MEELRSTNWQLQNSHVEKYSKGNTIIILEEIKVEELRSTNWQLQNSHVEKYSKVNNIIITMYGARWVLDLSGGTTL